MPRPFFKVYFHTIIFMSTLFERIDFGNVFVSKELFPWSFTWYVKVSIPAGNYMFRVNNRNTKTSVKQ